MKLNEEMLRLYAVTDRSCAKEKTLYAQVEEAIAGGAGCIQLREKELDAADFLREAKALAGLCHRFGVPLLINDNVEIALRSGADGVHVGQDDMDAAQVRRLVGKDMIIGVTARNVAEALRAQEAGADYLGSGAVFGSATKLNARPMERETLKSICGAVSIPVVAIGGIHRGNISSLAGTGVRGVAVVSGIFAAEDIRAECRLLRALSEEMVRKEAGDA